MNEPLGLPHCITSSGAAQRTKKSGELYSWEEV